MNDSVSVQDQLTHVMVEMRAMYGAERRIRQELAKAELEKRELLELLKDLQPIRATLPAQEPGSQDNNEPGRQLQTGASTHGSSLSLNTASRPQPLSSQLGEKGRKSSTRSLSIDYTKRKNREVTVI